MPAADMGQVRRNTAARRSYRELVAQEQGRKKNLLPGDCFAACRLRRRLALLLQPCFVLIRLLRNSQEAHVGVLRAAILRALALRSSGMRGLDTDEVMPGNQDRLCRADAESRTNASRLRLNLDIDWLMRRKMNLVGGGELLDPGCQSR